MTFGFAGRVGRVEPSATVAIGDRAAELEADGIDIVDLSLGEPDFRTPENVVRAAKESLEAGDHGYTPSNGIPDLRAAIVDYLAEVDLEYGPEDVIVTPGAKQALYEIVNALIDEGDDVVLLDPAWVSYEAMVELSGGSLSRVDLSPGGFALEPALADLNEAISSETALLIVNSPCNPSGAVYSDRALEGIRDLAVDHDVTVISDEIYREVTYGDAPTAVATLDGMRERTVTVNGFSKAFAMTGWRLGYLAAPQPIVREAGKIHTHTVSSAANFVQHAGVEALRNARDATSEMVATFRARRDALVDQLAALGVDVPTPQGAFYLMLPVADDDVAWCERAIAEAHVATVPGSAFGTPGYARLSYAASQDRISTAVDRLERADLLLRG